MMTLHGERLTAPDWGTGSYAPWELCGMEELCQRGSSGCTGDCAAMKQYLRLAAYEDAEAWDCRSCQPLETELPF